MKRWFLSALFLVNTALAAQFLPVEEAFDVNVQRIGDELIVDFSIVDDYYLYRDPYRAVAQSGATIGDGVFSDNVLIKFDENFGEDVAVFYNYKQVVHPVTGDGNVQITYQGCADAGLCYPPQKLLFSLDGERLEIPRNTVASLEGLDLTAGNDLTANADAGSAAIAGLTLISALLFAMVGGLVLNLMPCVFPVLSIKAMQMTQMGDDSHHARAHGLAYTAGVILSFMAVAGVLLLVRYFGEWVGWGFQLQSPYFVAFLVFLFFVMALSMSGYIEFGQRFMGVGQDLTQKSGMTGSFFTGVLAVVVATPCTAPFMGSAIGFALLQPPYVSLLIFAAMGLGLALPILAISLIPAAAKLMPKPGAWMNGFRQLMAFPLFATVLWLLWVLVEIKGTQALLSVGIGLLLFTMAVWPALTVQSKQGLKLTWFKRTARAALILGAVVLVFDQREQPEMWQPYSAELVSASLSEGKSVFIDVTAAWCITCKANERVALSGDRFEALVNETEVVLIKADWTNPSPAVDQLIASFNRDGVPLYAYYHKGSLNPVVLPQILNSGLIEQTFTGQTAL